MPGFFEDVFEVAYCRCRAILKAGFVEHEMLIGSFSRGKNLGKKGEAINAF
jgi:hypothetical protein